MYNSTILCCTWIYTYFLDYIRRYTVKWGIFFGGLLKWYRIKGEIAWRIQNKMTQQSRQYYHAIPWHAKPSQNSDQNDKTPKWQNQMKKRNRMSKQSTYVCVYLCSMNCERDDYNLWTNIAPKCQVLKSLRQVWWLMNIFASINTNTLLSRISVGVWK